MLAFYFLTNYQSMDTKFFGDYNIIKQIGQGALGTVYLAEHRFMKRQYVLKVLPEELSSDRAFLQRLEDEIAILASLDHYQLVKIHNISFAQGQYFIVTDCIVDDLGETTNLAQYLLSRNRRLEEQTIMHILKQVADALDYAHLKKNGGKVLAHLGLKLNNIQMGKSKGGNCEIFLTDFGLSRIVGIGAVLTRTYLTVAESLGIGQAKYKSYANIPNDFGKLTPLHTSFLQNFAFLAPEQKRGDSSLVDAKTDVYAFGILAYYLLTGDFPEGLFEMPSVRHSGFEWHWDDLIVSCLQVDPEKRPSSLLQALKSLLKKQLPLPPQEMPSPVIPQVVKTPPIDALKPVIQKAQLERPQHDPDPAAVFQIDKTVNFYVPESKEVNNVQPLLTDMVVIQGGTFYRGSNDGNRDEHPRHQVHIASFAIDIHPVTNEQFVRFLEVMGGEKDSNHQDIIRLRDSRIKRSGGRLSIESGYAKHPVVGVTWYGAVAYAKWVGKRLPTEAEWEISASGGEKSNLYTTGEDIEKSQANFFSSDTTPVMSYAANSFGLHDIAGNVYQWCHDWYGYNYYEISVQEPENPKGPLQGVYRVLRGGCWKSLKEDLRCSRRHRNNPGTVNGTYGFRCAALVQPQEPLPHL